MRFWIWWFGMAVAFTGWAPKEGLAATQEAIAFCRLTDEIWQIWTVAPDGTGLRQLTDSPVDKRSPAWSPDGRRLAYRTSNGELLVQDLTSGKEERWLSSYESIDDPRWPAGKPWLIFTRYKPKSRCHADVWVAGLNGEEPKQLTTSACSEFHPSLSPDGRWLLYISADETSNASSQHQIWKQDLEHLVSYRLTQADAYHAHPVWSPNGRQIVYSSNVTGDYEIWLMQADGSYPVRLTMEPGLDTSPAWSPEGQQIVFVSGRTGRAQLWVMNVDGLYPRPLLTDEAEVADPVWGRSAIS